MPRKLEIDRIHAFPNSRFVVSDADVLLILRCGYRRRIRR
jgi:hypothetical protein